MKPSSRGFFKLPRRGYFHKSRHPLHGTQDANWEKMLACAKRKTRSSFGWLRDGIGAIEVFENQRNGDLIEVRVIEYGHLKRILRGKSAREWSASH